MRHCKSIRYGLMRRVLFNWMILIVYADDQYCEILHSSLAFWHKYVGFVHLDGKMWIRRRNQTQQRKQVRKHPNKDVTRANRVMAMCYQQRRSIVDCQDQVYAYRAKQGKKMNEDKTTSKSAGLEPKHQHVISCLFSIIWKREKNWIDYNYMWCIH